MGSLSIWHWFIVILFAASYGIPMAIILGRAGWSRWWIVLFCIPFFNIIMLWAFALGRWPTVREAVHGGGYEREPT